MARFLFIRDPATGHSHHSEIGHYEDPPFTPAELATLDAGRHVVRPDAVFVDLTAYYLADQRDRENRAGALC